MPANLNALLRYKTINYCLYGGKRRWSIDELRDKCSDALAESRGRYIGVFERTIRDNIRVMRSDILGFNAPIEQKGGLYFYSDPAARPSPAMRGMPSFSRRNIAGVLWGDVMRILGIRMWQ